MCAAVSYAGAKIELKDLLIQKVIYIRDLKKLKLEIKQGDGPMFYPSLDNETEVRFWYKPGITTAAGLGRIVLIATGHPNDENHGNIVWPKDRAGHDYGTELESIFPRDKK
jgi:hypothetical protein